MGVVSGPLVVPVAHPKTKSYRALWWFRWLRLSGSRIGPSGGSGGSSTVVSGPLVVPVANQLKSCRWGKKSSNKICHVTEGDKRSAGIIS